MPGQSPAGFSFRPRPGFRFGAAVTVITLCLLVSGCTAFLPPQSPVNPAEVAPVPYAADSFWYQPIAPGAMPDPVSGVEYDFWQLRKERGRWVASSIALLDYASEPVHSRKFSVTASGFPLGAGLIHPQDLAEGGSIDHALVFGYPLTRLDAFVSPATRSDGRMQDADALPMGAQIQLDPSLDLDSLDPPLTEVERIIARALQTYGAYLYDTGSPGSIIELNGINPRSFATDPYLESDGYNQEGGFLDVGNIPVDRFRVLELGPVHIWGQEFPTEISFPERYYGVD